MRNVIRIAIICFINSMSHCSYECKEYLGSFYYGIATVVLLVIDSYFQEKYLVLLQ